MIDIKKIVVPVDFSETSKKAAKYGLTLAVQLKAQLTLAHVVTDVSAFAYPVSSESGVWTKEQYEMATRDIRNIIPPEFANVFGVNTLVRIGNIETGLLEIIKEQAADLVVMGTHGRRYPGRWFLGSVTEHMLRKVSVPILTVSHVEADTKAIELGLVVLRRILFATDLSEESRSGLQYAIQLAKTAGAELTVLHVLDEIGLLYWGGASIGTLEQDRKRFADDLNEKLRGLVAREKTADLQIETLVLQGKPYSRILAFAEDRGMDMIVLNLQSKGVLDSAFLGATAERVVRLAPIPVLSVPIDIA